MLIESGKAVLTKQGSVTPGVSTVALFLDLAFSRHMLLLRIKLFTKVLLSIWTQLEAETLTWGLELKREGWLLFMEVSLSWWVSRKCQFCLHRRCHLLHQWVCLCNVYVSPFSSVESSRVGFLMQEMPCSDRRAVWPPLRTVIEYIVFQQEALSFWSRKSRNVIWSPEG